MWPDKSFIQGEKNAEGKGSEGSFQEKQHLAVFIGRVDDIIFSTGQIWATLRNGTS